MTTRRVKTLRVSPDLLLNFARRGVTACACVGNPLPDDAKIIGVWADPNPMAFLPGKAPPVDGVVFYVESASFPEYDFESMVMPPELDSPVLEDRCPHRVGVVPSLLPHAVTLTRAQLASLLYESGRQPGLRVTIEVSADGSWRVAEGVYEP